MTWEWDCFDYNSEQSTYSANSSSGDENLVDYGTGLKHVRFIAEELTKYVHHVLNSRRLQHATVYQLKFHTQRAKLGYYMTLLLSCKGEWPSQAVQASSRVQ